jgi:F0F1-type ATP synthase assembly protein I
MHKPVKSDSATTQVATAMQDGWIQGGSFLGSILSGTLLGLLADRWLGTEPWLVVVGVLVGSYSGFLNVWHQSKKAEELNGRS